MAIAKTCLQFVTTGQLQTPLKDVTNPEPPCTTVAAQVYGTRFVPCTRPLIRNGLSCNATSTTAPMST